jgi:hypothetical protein
MIDKDEVLQNLKEGICKVVFTKVNGDSRTMHCTLNEKHLPAQVEMAEATQKKKPNPDVLAVWDTQAEGWRSFRWDSLTDVNTGFDL